MSQSYTPEFKKKIVRLHIEEGRTYKSITAEYGVSKASISKWCAEFSEECHTKPSRIQMLLMIWNLWKKTSVSVRNWKKQKGESLLKKSSGILRKGNRLEAYRFIDQYHETFGIRWLLRRLKIYPNAYYNYRKHRKADYHAHKAEVQAQIHEIYHEHNGVDGYRSMTVYLARKGYHYSPATIHKYMNAELGLRSIVRPQKQIMNRENHTRCLKTNFSRILCRIKSIKMVHRFHILILKNHDVRYNCSIIDLHDRSVIASITDRHITSDLAIRTLQKALDSQPAIKGELILHSDQGSQYTSKAFTDFASQWMWRRVWAKQVIPMTMHRWSVTSIHWRMNAQICMSSKQRKNSTKQWRNFPMSTTIMYARIAPTVTVRHIRHESQDKKGLPEQIAWLLKIGTVSFCQGQSCDSGVKHPWWNLTVPIDSKLQSTDFISHKCYKNAWPQHSPVVASVFVNWLSVGWFSTSLVSWISARFWSV